MDLKERKRRDDVGRAQGTRHIHRTREQFRGRDERSDGSNKQGDAATTVTPGVLSRGDEKKTTRLATNPHDFTVDHTSFLGTSGQNVQDVLKLAPLMRARRTRSRAMRRQEFGGGAQPCCDGNTRRAPDTLACYPSRIAIHSSSSARLACTLPDANPRSATSACPRRRRDARGVGAKFSTAASPCSSTSTPSRSTDSLATCAPTSPARSSFHATRPSSRVSSNLFCAVCMSKSRSVRPIRQNVTPRRPRSRARERDETNRPRRCPALDLALSPDAVVPKDQRLALDRVPGWFSNAGHRCAMTRRGRSMTRAFGDDAA